MRQLGKVGKRRAKGMRLSAPIVCERAGGVWCGNHCEGATCEGWLPVRGRKGDIKAWLQCPNMAADMAHIDSRARGGDESPENIAALCQWCHGMLDGADRETRKQLREKLRERIEGRANDI